MTPEIYSRPPLHGSFLSCLLRAREALACLACQPCKHDRTMTSALKGIEPPLPSSASSFQLPLNPNRVTVPNVQLPPRSWPRQNSRDDLDPPLKKLKLGGPASVQNSESTVAPASGSATPVPQLASSDRPINVEQSQRLSRHQAQIVFPPRPGAHRALGAKFPNRPQALDRAARKDVVPVNAYVAELPTCAPSYHEAGKYLLCRCLLTMPC